MRFQTFAGKVRVADDLVEETIAAGEHRGGKTRRRGGLGERADARGEDARPRREIPEAHSLVSSTRGASSARSARGEGAVSASVARWTKETAGGRSRGGRSMRSSARMARLNHACAAGVSAPRARTSPGMCAGAQRRQSCAMKFSGGSPTHASHAAVPPLGLGPAARPDEARSSAPSLSLSSLSPNTARTSALPADISGRARAGVPERWTCPVSKAFRRRVSISRAVP